MPGCCEHANGPAGSVNVREFIAQYSDVNKVSASHRWLYIMDGHKCLLVNWRS